MFGEAQRKALDPEPPRLSGHKPPTHSDKPAVDLTMFHGRWQIVLDLKQLQSCDMAPCRPCKSFRAVEHLSQNRKQRHHNSLSRTLRNQLGGCTLSVARRPDNHQHPGLQGFWRSGFILWGSWYLLTNYNCTYNPLKSPCKITRTVISTATIGK